MRILAVLLALPPWSEPTDAGAVAGLATYYSGTRMEQVAAYRGYGGGREPVALMACGNLGRDVWLVAGGQWVEGHVVDCARRDHYADRVTEGKVAELSWSLWLSLGLPRRPVPVLVLFAEPPGRWQ
jgi:hypothetical protein